MRTGAYLVCEKVDPGEQLALLVLQPPGVPLQLHDGTLI